MPSSDPELVKFKPRTCQVQVQNLSSSSPELVTFEPGTCQVLSWHLSGSILQLVQFEPTLIGHACMHIQSSLVTTKKPGANAQLRCKAVKLSIHGNKQSATCGAKLANAPPFGKANCGASVHPPQNGGFCVQLIRGNGDFSARQLQVRRIRCAALADPTSGSQNAT